MERIPMTSEQALAFEQCMDFLADMIIKYGGEIDLQQLKSCSETDSQTDEREKGVAS